MLVCGGTPRQHVLCRQDSVEPYVRGFVGRTAQQAPPVVFSDCWHERLQNSSKDRIAFDNSNATDVYE